MSDTLTITDVRDLIEHDDAPLRYLSMRMGQKPFWALYFECQPAMRGQSPTVTSFICPPGITITLEPFFGRDGHTMDVADQYYADIESGALPKPETKSITPEEENQVLSDLRDFLNEAAAAGAIPDAQRKTQETADDDSEELERLRAEGLAELDVAYSKLDQVKQRNGVKGQPTPKGYAGVALLLLSFGAALCFW